MSLLIKSQIFLDANFILTPSTLNVDIYEQLKINFPNSFELVVLSAIFTELEEKIKKYPRKTKLKQEYQLCRAILEQQKYSLIQCERRHPGKLVDDLLLEYAINSFKQGKNVYIATNDKELRRKCRYNKIKVIFVRQNKFLEIE
ncbi:MAG: hypothetical protein ACTSQ5_08590 [Promethearchaeota archaeon]